MKEKDYRAIRRYNELRAVYPSHIPDDILFPLIYDAKAPEFNRAVTRYKRRWLEENGYRPKGRRPKL